MTEQGVMPETAQCGGRANDQQSLLKHAAGAGKDEGIVKNKKTCLVLICDFPSIHPSYSMPFLLSHCARIGIVR